MEINIGSVWIKKPTEWLDEGGQLVVVERVTLTNIKYRYTNSTIHNTAIRSIDQFLKRMELIKE